MLDWTVSDHPGEPEPTAPPGAPPPRQRGRGWWLALGAVTVTAAAGAWLWTLYQAQARETSAVAILAAAPLAPPLIALKPLGEAEIETVTARPDGGLQITAVYGFQGVDGSSLRFRAVRVFDAAGHPATSPTAPRISSFSDQHLMLTYDSTDEALVAEDLGPFLKAVLGEACATWSCPEDIVVHISLEADADPNDAVIFAETSDIAPANRVFAYAQLGIIGESVLAFPRPSTGGAPADDATRAYWRSTIADLALIRLAYLIRRADTTFYAPVLSNHAFFYALVLRQAARSGVEDAHWLEARAAEPGGPSAQALWRAEAQVLRAPGVKEAALRSALGFVNRVAQAGLLTERALFTQLRPERTFASWVGGAFAASGQSANQTVTTIGGPSAVDEINRLAQPATWSAAIECADGQWLWTSAGGRLPLALSNDALAPLRLVGARSTPYGLDLALTLGDSLLVRSSRMGEFGWVAGASRPAVTAFAGWIGSNVAYYVSDPGQLGTDLELITPERPADVMARLVDVYRLAPAPTGDIAFVVSTAFNTNRLLDGSGLLRVTLPLNGLDHGFAVGYLPAWAPDGQRAAVLIAPESGTDWGGGLSVGILMSVTQPEYAIEVWSPARVGRVAVPGSDMGEIAWSPHGDSLAIAARVARSAADPAEPGLWLMRPHASGSIPDTIQQLEGPTDADSLSSLAFSADGRYLSVVATRGNHPALMIFSSDTGALLITMPDVFAVAWAPHGHTAIALSPDGAGLITEPGATPTPLVGSECTRVLWNPTP